jgi:hypothetical protein
VKPFEVARTLASSAGHQIFHRVEFVLLIPFLVCLVIVVGIHHGVGTTTRPVFSVAQLGDDTSVQAMARVGTRIQVNGVAWPCAEAALTPAFPCLDRQPQPVLVDAATRATVPLEVSAEDRFFSLLLGLPLVGAIVPVQHALWGQNATYQVQVERVPADRCLGSDCLQLALLHASGS